MYVREWMTKDVVAAPPTIMVLEAMRIMDQKGFRRLPVVDRGQLVGIVTRSDIQAFLGKAAPGADLHRGAPVPLRRVMASTLITVKPGDALEHAALLMLENRVSGLPVVDEGRLVGIITETDIFKAFVEFLGVREGGARITFEFRDGQEMLDHLKQRLGEMALRSLVTYRSGKEGRWHAVVRVRGRRKEEPAEPEPQKPSPPKP